MMENLQTLQPPDGTPPVCRVKDANSAREIWGQLRMADAPSSAQRAMWDTMFDQVPPLNEAELIANGEGHRVNVAMPIAPTLFESAQAGYVDIINSTEVLFDCPTMAGTPEERPELESVVAEEVTNCMRSDPDFTINFLQNTSIFIKQAVSVMMFKDEFDWRSDAYGLSDFKIPRKIKIGQGNIDVAAFLRFYSPTELYQCIKDPDRAEQLGYNVPAIRRTIMDWVNNSNTFTQWRNYEWEKLEIELRNNDYFWTYGVAQTKSIRVVHMYWTEFDGRVTSAMISDNDDNENKWLYLNVGRFANSYEAYVVFCYGVGTNGFYHGIRGLGYMIFPIVQAMNRAYCLMLEMAMYGSAPIFQPNDESAMEAMQFTPMGIYSLITPGITIQPSTVSPNLQNGPVAALNIFSQLLKQTAASANTEALINDSKEQTKFEVQAKLATDAKLSVASINLFYDPMQIWLRETVRRMKRKDYQITEGGGEYIIGLHRRLLDRGQGNDKYLQAFYKLDTERLTVRKAIGSGSEAARMLAFDRLMSLYGSFDAEGQQNLLRDVVAEYVGYRNAGRYVQAVNAPQRPTLEASIAELQNDALLGNQNPPPTVKPNDNHLVHAQIHLSAEVPLIQQLQQLMATAPLQSVPLLEGLNALNQHTTQHVKFLSANPVTQPQAAQMRKAISDADEVLQNGILHVSKLMRKAQEAQQVQQATQDGPQSSPQPQQGQSKDQMPQDVLLRLEGDLAYRKAQIGNLEAKTQLMVAQGQQKLALADAQAAAKVRGS